jgi:CHASE2 domain-containing sensor protein
VPPPPGIPDKRVGFNDFVLDPDGVIRRNLLFVSDGKKTSFSFSLRLALAYLKSQGISSQQSQQNPEYMQLGSSVFVPIKADSGGYKRLMIEATKFCSITDRGLLHGKLVLPKYCKGKLTPVG